MSSMHPRYLNVPSPLPYMAVSLLCPPPVVNAHFHLEDLRISPSPVVRESLPRTRYGGLGEGVKCPALQGSASQGHAS